LCFSCYINTGENEEGVKFDVINAQTYAGYVVHVGTLTEGSIKVSSSFPTLCQYNFVRKLGGGPYIDERLRVAPVCVEPVACC
jgi:hypothetical protein